MEKKQNKRLIKRIIKILLYNIKFYVLFVNFIQFIQKIKLLFFVARQRKLRILLQWKTEYNGVFQLYIVFIV